MSEREIELKLLCEPVELDRIRQAPSLLKLKQGRATGKHLHSVYFDTKSLALGDHGFALRLRRAGAACVQTLKTESGASGGATGALARDTGEYEVRLPRGAEKPDLNKLPQALKARIQKLANGDAIGARLVSDIRRTIHNLQTENGDLIEMAFDLGALQANGGEAQVSEIELELKAGSPASLYRIALDLNEVADLRVGTKSKSERGFALLRPRAPVAVKAEPLLLDHNAPLEDAYGAVLRHCLVHMTANEAAAVDARLPEGLHQMRVALRRARSAFEIFRPVIGGAQADKLAAEAKWLANELGPARDFDVFVTEIVAPVTPRGAGFKKLQALAEEKRAEKWERALTALRSRRYTRFLLEYGLFLAEQDWRLKRKAPALARIFAAEALDKRLAKVAKRGRDFEKLEGEARHDLRKQLKKLRYGLHFFSSLYDAGEVKPYLKHLGEMQDVFGGLNDVATAHLILDDMPGEGAVGEAAARVIAWHGERAEKAWKGAIRLWKRFNAVDPFWRV
ncbi:CHAD domain containing protein [Parvibaculum lavamentivorans DS-1]|uniref:CHAD domain containing protein n=1 Tax=Parvibaculum lavamentivorans (strain DS-1 / DSM 13023 / NCIMB 13966) TaxID=402881 RepID=A7HSG9_PARL1|nr:CYTH and CHAD domain-containing protein [Parvibaculum lavamentivorans]ABS62852.1 CHAD domain containing protein [Parvibaculum lavamentivorans DS-1]